MSPSKVRIGALFDKLVISLSVVFLVLKIDVTYVKAVQYLVGPVVEGGV